MKVSLQSSPKPFQLQEAGTATARRPGLGFANPRIQSQMLPTGQGSRNPDAGPCPCGSLGGRCDF